jgi:hypothetical protein
MKKNLERLNDADGIRSLESEIRKVFPLKAVDRSGLAVPKGTTYAEEILLDGRPEALELRLRSIDPAMSIYMTVYWNGSVIWEDYVKDAAVSLIVNPVQGLNQLEILPWNMPLNLDKLELSPAAAAAEPAARKNQPIPPGTGERPGIQLRP